MLTSKRLEAMIELEDNLKTQYQTQLAAKDAEITHITQERDEQKDALTKQLEQIQTLSGAASGNAKLEQQNRELHQHCEDLKDDIVKQKQRTKNLQNDLNKERAALAELRKLDPEKMKKNLDANKKKLAERTDANELIQKILSKTKAENSELQAKVKELETRLAEREGA